MALTRLELQEHREAILVCLQSLGVSSPSTLCAEADHLVTLTGVCCPRLPIAEDDAPLCDACSVRYALATLLTKVAELSSEKKAAEVMALDAS